MTPQQATVARKGAHPVLQMRTQVLDERLGWYPDFRTKDENEIKRAA